MKTQLLSVFLSATLGFSLADNALASVSEQAKKRVLIVVTSYGKLGNTGKPTGYYLPEVAHPYSVLQESGFEIDIASPAGGNAPMDPKSRDLNDAVNKSFMENKT